MIKVGVTGGIGSGKSTVARLFQKKGISVYYADNEAKKLMVDSNELRSKIIAIFSEDAYRKNELDRAFLADQVFGNPAKLAKLNAIVHPVVRKHFDNWCVNQSSQYVIKEAAVLFENGGFQYCDFTILVTAPKEMRIQRVIKRDGSTREQIESRMSAQWSDIKKITLSDCVLRNIDFEKTKGEVDRVHKHLCKRIDRGWNPVL